MADKSITEMSDDEIAQMSAPPPAEKQEEVAETDEAKAGREQAEADQAEADRLAAEEADKEKPEDKDADKAAQEDPDDATVAAADKPVDKAVDKAEEKPGEKGADSLGSEAKPDAKASEKLPKPDVAPAIADKAAPLKGEDQEPEALASFYNKIMTPFKANGKTIELKSPEEAIQLMQMGANYTRKLQDIQPHRKMILMLQNNDLLDEGKLSYLIDLDKKNPEAIKRLIKESGLDPLEIDTDKTDAYQPGNHSVTDAEANFRSTMGELVSSDPKGKETVEEIYGNWDDTSKEALWKNPEIMPLIHEQRQTGVYDLIKAEVDRRITLGSIKANTPFLEAYKTIGDEMVAEEAAKAPKVEDKSKPDAKRDVLATRAAAPKSKVGNGDKASAASTTRTSTSAAKTVVNPLSLSDEDFLKQMEGRV